MLDPTRDIFVISDLHMGDGGPRDNFAASFGKNIARLAQLYTFLEMVKQANGQLVILGDLFELWQSNIGAVLKYRLPVLKLFSEINSIYVVGNHDVDFQPLIDSNLLNHPFFSRMMGPFECTMSGKRFKFMHGHEVDPFNKGLDPSWGRLLTIVAGVFEDRVGSPILPGGSSVEDSLSGIGERMLSLWNWLMRWWPRLGWRVKVSSPKKDLTPRQKPSRLKEHIQQIKADKKAEGYNVAIVGHTHKPGRYEDWYYNSGSWVGIENGSFVGSYLKIKTDGEVEVFNWIDNKEIKGDTVIDISI